MKRTILFLSLALTALIATAQENSEKKGTMFTLTGMVRDKLTSAQLINAEIRLFDQQDSLIAKGEAHERQWDYNRGAAVETSRYEIEFRKSEIKRVGTFKMRIAAEGHDTLWQDISLRDVGRRELMRDLGTHYLTKTRTVNLDEVTVTATKIKFYHRGDTLVYNADAFQLAEGSMLDALIKQLPGVELKEGGEIFVNGKKVESLLLNGKDFFRGDNQLMLDNLGAYTVKNIEVYKKQTDRARFLGLDSEKDKQLTMDVKMKKEYIGGWSGNIEAGGGTEDRYLGKLFAMHFNAKSQFALLGNMNNLNDLQRPTNDNSWEPQFRPNGTKTYKQISASYSTENDEATHKASGSVTFEAEKDIFEQESNSTNFLQTMTTQGSATNSNVNRDYNFSTQNDLYWQNSWLALKFDPYMKYNRGKNESDGESAMWKSPTPDNSQTPSPLGEGRDGAFINRSLSEAFGGNRRLELGSSLMASVKIPKTSDAIDLYASFNHRNNRDENDSRNIIQYGDPTLPTSARNTLSSNRPQHFNYGNLGASYLLRLSDKVNLKLAYYYTYHRETKNSVFYLGQLEASQTGDYTLENLRSIERTLDPTNSNNSLDTRYTHRITPFLSWKLSKEIELFAEANFNARRFSIDLTQNAKDHRATFNENAFSGNINLNWNKVNERGNTTLLLEYSSNRQQPELTYLMEIDNTRDPLVRTVGNPDLKSTEYHRLFAFLETRRNNKYTLYGYAYGGPILNQIVTGSTFDTQTGRRTYRYYNVDGAWYFTTRMYLLWEVAKWLTVHPDFGYNHRKDFTMIGENALVPTKYSLNINRYSPLLEFRFHPTQNLNISLKTSTEFQHSTSDNPSARKTNYREDSHSLTADANLPWNFSFQTTLMNFSRHGFDDEKMNTSEWIWNGRITKSLLKGKLLASLSAYDLLHQIQTVTYTVSPDSKTETFTNTIPRYVLLHFQYKFNITPKQKIAQNVKYY